MGIFRAKLWAVVVVSLILLRRNPGLISERSRVKADAKAWDRRLLAAINLLGQGAMLVVAGLDQRFGWTGEGVWSLHLIGLVLVGVGIGLVSWAMAANRFFSRVMRIQKDRDHQVVSVGPYRFVRHPGYAGLILFALAAPALLGSLWALIPEVFSVGLIVLRTLLEDKTLLVELEGYEEYSLRVRQRLIPGVW